VVAAADALGWGGVLALSDIENGSAEKNSRMIKALKSDILKKSFLLKYHRKLQLFFIACNPVDVQAVKPDQNSSLFR